MSGAATCNIRYGAGDDLAPTATCKRHQDHPPYNPRDDEIGHSPYTEAELAKQGLKWVSYVYDDGGRKAAGFKGSVGDCVVRSIAIASQRPYLDVYNELSLACLAAGRTKSARNGVPRPVIRKFFKEHGWLWTPTMGIGTGCTVHLRPDELPSGRIVCSLSKHLVAVIDGIPHDTHDASRGGTRCVYGHWSQP